MSRRRLVKVAVALLIVLCLATALWFEYIAPELRRLKIENDAGSNIYNNGGLVMKDGSVLVSETKDFRRRDFGDRQLKAMAPSLSLVGGFHSLLIDRTAVTDAGISQLAAVTELEGLDVSGTQVTVNGLLTLQRLPKLSAIVVSPGQLSDSDMKRLYSAFRKPRVWFGVYVDSQRQMDPWTTSPETSPRSTTSHGD